MCIYLGIIKLIRIKRQFKSMLKSQKLKFRQISYTLNIIRLQYTVFSIYHTLLTLSTTFVTSSTILIFFCFHPYQKVSCFILRILQTTHALSSQCPSLHTCTIHPVYCCPIPHLKTRLYCKLIALSKIKHNAEILPNQMKVKVLYL